MKPQSLLMAALLGSVILAGCVDGNSNPGLVPDDDFGPGFQPSNFDAAGFPVPVLRCHDRVEKTAWDAEGQLTDFIVLDDETMCNFEMTPDEGREGNEVTIAVNPLDPQNIVGGAKDYYEPDAGQCVWNGVYVTHDGGRSAYEDRSFDGSPWRAADGDPSDFRPNYASTYWCTTDPVAYFDVNGNLYYLLMAYQTDPVTGGKTGEGLSDECPDGMVHTICETAWGGALNDWAFNRAVQIVAKSTDGGDTFETFTPVMEGTFPATFHDKGWIAASADGTIHVMWWAAYLPGNLYFRSTDGGQTFSDPEVLSLTQGPADACGLAARMECETVVGAGEEGSEAGPVGLGDAGQGSFVDVGTGAEVYVLWNDLGLLEDSGVQLRRSFDHGATWDEQRAIFETNGASMPTIDGRDRRGGHPQLATDRNPDSPFADSLYIVWQDSCQNTTWSKDCRTVEDENGTLAGSGIWLRASYDQGTTWEEPVRVSDAPPGAHEWRIFPTVSVSPGGVVDVSWMDSTGARWLDCVPDAGVGEAHCPDQYQALGQRYAYSLDGGKTFSQTVEVRDADDNGWDTALCHHQNGEIFIGDYNDIDSSWQAAHPVWPDSRDGPCDVYTATIQRPMFAQGWDAEKKMAAVDWIAAHPI